eukprot:m.479484 g.479484  ORF g.479484 m.479484 type:complete len:538 (+) comp21465_c0_seq1:599-2212(+)
MASLMRWIAHRLRLPKIQITCDPPSYAKLPCEPPKGEFEEEFGLHHKDQPLSGGRTSDDVLPTGSSSSSSSSSSSDSTSGCIRISASALVLVAVAIGTVVLCREYLGSFMRWLADLGGWKGPAMFSLLFIVVSMPMVWGYLILNLGAGYIWGLWQGTLITSMGANIGSTVAFFFCRVVLKSYVLKTLNEYDNFRQILRVLEGRQGFRIIFMTRLTPVPFGLQNALFSASKVSWKKYASATFFGLLPTQFLNTYMGTTLRSMEDVLAGKSNNSVLLIVQVVAALGVTYFVNHKMKSEVQQACKREQDNMAAMAASISQHHHNLRKSMSQASFLVPEETTLDVSGEAEVIDLAVLAGGSESDDSGVVTGATQSAVGMMPSDEANPEATVATASSHLPSMPISLSSVSLGSGASGTGGGSSSGLAVGSPPPPIAETAFAVLPSLPQGQVATKLYVPHATGPTTSRGIFVKGHRRSQSAGPVLTQQLLECASPPRRDNVIKLKGLGKANAKLGTVVKTSGTCSPDHEAREPTLQRATVLDL